MACLNPFENLRLATEYLGPELYTKASPNDVWTNLIPRGTYPVGAGLNLSVFTIGRSLPTTDEPTATPITLTTSEDYTGSCGDSYTTLHNGYIEKTYTPEAMAFQSDVICQDDMIYNWKASEFWGKYMPALAKNVQKQISNRYQSIYTFFAPRWVVNEGTFEPSAGQTGTPTTSPDLTLDESLCTLTQDHLDTLAVNLIQNGATEPNSDGWFMLSEAGPVFSLEIGIEASNQLWLNNSEFRQDGRFAFMGEGEAMPLIKRLGASRIIKNFRHVVNPFPPRYSYADGEYTRVPTWIMPAGSGGNVAQINPDYLDPTVATHEAARVLTKWVFESNIVPSVNSVPGVQWSPKSYTGEWQLVVGGREITPDGSCFDPLKKLARLYSQFKHAPKPIFPEYGATIFFKRCQPEYTCQTCS